MTKAIVGKITDKSTGEPIWNAHIVFTDDQGNPYSPLMGTVSDIDGNFSFDTLGGYTLKITHLSYQDVIVPIDITAFQSDGGYQAYFDIKMVTGSNTLPEVVIKPQQSWWEKNRYWLMGALGVGIMGYFITANNK